MNLASIWDMTYRQLCTCLILTSIFPLVVALVLFDRLNIVEMPNSYWHIVFYAIVLPAVLVSLRLIWVSKEVVLKVMWGSYAVLLLVLAYYYFLPIAMIQVLVSSAIECTFFNRCL